MISLAFDGMALWLRQRREACSGWAHHSACWGTAECRAGSLYTIHDGSLVVLWLVMNEHRHYPLQNHSMSV